MLSEEVFWHNAVFHGWNIDKNDPAWTGDPVDAGSLYLFFCGILQAIQIRPFQAGRE